MPRSKVVAISSDSSLFDEIHTYLSRHDIDYQRYDSFEAYSENYDASNHSLIVDTQLALDSVVKEMSLFEKNRLNCTYLVVYEHSNCIQSLKRAFEYGADDYLILPIQPELVSLKLIALQKRLEFWSNLNMNEQNTIVFNNLTIEPLSKQIMLNNHKLDLTHSEFNILYTLAKNPNDVFNMEYLFQMITGQKSLGDYNALMTHVSRLRKKIAHIDPTHHYILTVRNKGYKFNALRAEQTY